VSHQNAGNYPSFEATTSNVNAQQATELTWVKLKGGIEVNLQDVNNPNVPTTIIDGWGQANARNRIHKFEDHPVLVAPSNFVAQVLRLYGGFGTQLAADFFMNLLMQIMAPFGGQYNDSNSVMKAVQSCTLLLCPILNDMHWTLIVVHIGPGIINVYAIDPKSSSSTGFRESRLWQCDIPRVVELLSHHVFENRATQLMEGGLIKFINDSNIKAIIGDLTQFPLTSGIDKHGNSGLDVCSIIHSIIHKQALQLGLWKYCDTKTAITNALTMDVVARLPLI
jgi:hypothetical protein